MWPALARARARSHSRLQTDRLHSRSETTIYLCFIFLRSSGIHCHSMSSGSSESEGDDVRPRAEKRSNNNMNYVLNQQIMMRTFQGVACVCLSRAFGRSAVIAMPHRALALCLSASAEVLQRWATGQTPNCRAINSADRQRRIFHTKWRNVMEPATGKKIITARAFVGSATTFCSFSDNCAFFSSISTFFLRRPMTKSARLVFCSLSAALVPKEQDGGGQSYQISFHYNCKRCRRLQFDE